VNYTASLCLLNLPQLKSISLSLSLPSSECSDIKIFNFHQTYNVF